VNGISEPEVIGFMDIGTNSIHILVVKYFPNSLGTIVFQDKEIVDIGRDLYRWGKVGKEAMEKCCLISDRFTAAAKNMGAKDVIAFATCATREASNRLELLEALDSDGLDVRIIPGMEEARLVKLGVFGKDGPGERTLLMDVGGGSTEIILAENGRSLYLDSLAIGAVRYAYDSLSDPFGPVSGLQCDAMRKRVGMSSYHAVRSVRSIGFTRAIGSAGTIVSLAELCAERRDGDDSYIKREELKELMLDLREMTREEKCNVPKMSPARTDIIVSGGTIVESLMDLFGIETLEVSKTGLKEGMQVDHLMKKGESDFDVRGSSVQTLASRCLYDMPHAQEVREKALCLFDMMKSEGMHKMDSEARSLLGYAALLHDVGEFINYTKHNVHSYNIISNSALLGFDDEELESIALMTRFHHKKFPEIGDKHLRDMKHNTAIITLKCAMILKMADIMDRHRTRSVKSVDINVSEGEMELILSADDDIRMEMWSLEATADDFKKVFNTSLKVSCKDQSPINS